MKFIRNAILASLVLFGLSLTPAKAAIIDVADSNGYGYFMDTNTGYTWLDMDSFFGLTYNTMVTIVEGMGFTVATQTEVSQLVNSLPLNNGEWASYSGIMGSAPDRNLIWGAYDTGSATNHGWVYAFNYDQVWNYGGGVNNVVYNAGSTLSDLNIWAYSTNFNASVPETTSLVLLAFGLLGLGASARKKAA